MPRTNELVEVTKRAISKLRRVRTGPRDERTDTLREVAEAFVDARTFFYTKDAEVDWKGSTHAYRRWVREAFEKAGIPRDEASSLQAAIRYHAGNILRDRLDPQTLAELGLIAESPRERAAERRETTSGTSVLFTGSGPIEDFPSLQEVAATIESALVRSAISSSLSSPEREALREAFQRICDRAHDLAGAASK